MNSYLISLRYFAASIATSFDLVTIPLELPIATIYLTVMVW